MGKLTPARFPAGLTIGSLRMLNTYESTGMFEGKQSRLDDLVLEHIQVQRELSELNAYEETLVRMVAEGYTPTDIAEELGCSPATIRMKLNRIQWSLYGIEASTKHPVDSCGNIRLVRNRSTQDQGTSTTKP